MARHTRYQGAIVRDHRILLLFYHDGAGAEFWLFPGGGREAGESPEAAVQREMAEETSLQVRVERLLLEGPAHRDEHYRRLRTYLCQVVSGRARPGIEPEAPAGAGIQAVAWFDLRDEADWPLALRRDPITYPQLQLVRGALGYIEAPAWPW